MSARTRVFEVYLCRPSGSLVETYAAVLLDGQWRPVDPEPAHAVRSLGRFVAATHAGAEAHAKLIDDTIRDAVLDALKGGAS